MFLDLIRRRNPQLISAAMKLHQQGKIPANSYVIDLDVVTENSILFKAEADKWGLKTFAMTKQVGRHSGFCQALRTAGINKVVAVDMAGAGACYRAGMEIGHLGHLVQVPQAEADSAATILKPDYWTVFNPEKAQQAAQANAKIGRVQALLARIYARGDTFYRGHEGGFNAAEIVSVARQLNDLEGARFAGITTFPALLFDPKSAQVRPTHNLSTLGKAADALAKAGFNNIEINAPGTTSLSVLEILAKAGATQCEPGNALHGTTPLHAVQDLAERPAVVYLSEVSHVHADEAYCFGGGLYVDPVFANYEVQALVSNESAHEGHQQVQVEIPAPTAIDYYAMIKEAKANNLQTGASVVFGFRGQAFITRANIVGISGISSGDLQVQQIENGFGDKVTWPLKENRYA